MCLTCNPDHIGHACYNVPTTYPFLWGLRCSAVWCYVAGGGMTDDESTATPQEARALGTGSAETTGGSTEASSGDTFSGLQGNSVGGTTTGRVTRMQQERNVHAVSVWKRVRAKLEGRDSTFTLRPKGANQAATSDNDGTTKLSKCDGVTLVRIPYSSSLFALFRRLLKTPLSHM